MLQVNVKNVKQINFYHLIKQDVSIVLNSVLLVLQKMFVRYVQMNMKNQTLQVLCVPYVYCNIVKDVQLTIAVNNVKMAMNYRNTVVNVWHR